MYVFNQADLLEAEQRLSREAQDWARRCGEMMSGEERSRLQEVTSLSAELAQFRREAQGLYARLTEQESLAVSDEEFLMRRASLVVILCFSGVYCRPHSCVHPNPFTKKCFRSCGGNLKA